MKRLICGVIWAAVHCFANSAFAAEIAPVIVKQEHDRTVIGADRHATRTLHLQHREFRSELDQALCTGEVRKETHKALIQIGEYYRRATLWLAPKGAN